MFKQDENREPQTTVVDYIDDEAVDVDDDGVILAYDAALTLQYSVGIDPMPILDPLPWEPWRDSTANVDGAGDITAFDAGMILQYSAGIISEFSSEALKSAPVAAVTIEVEEWPVPVTQAYLRT